MVAVALGEAIAVLPREDQREGARHLVQALDAYAAATWDASLRVRYDSRFRRTHDYVAAMLYSDGAIELLPAVEGSREVTGRAQTPQSTTDRSSGLANIAAAINAAFQRTTGDD